MKSESRGRSVLSGGHKKSGSSKHKTHGIHVRRGKSGGYILKHDPTPDDSGMATEQEEHVAPDMNSVMAHLQSQFADQPDMQQSAPPPVAQGQAPPTPQA